MVIYPLIWVIVVENSNGGRGRLSNNGSNGSEVW